MRTILLAILLSFYSLGMAQEKIELYSGRIPNTKVGHANIDNQPAFYKYSPAKISSDKVFLVIPGGGYARVAIDHEGHDVAKRLRDLGYTAYVLRYRLPNDSEMVDKKIAPIQDAQAAMQHIRTNYKMAKIAVIGFSAGGHLASTLSTHFDTNYLVQKSATNYDLRPDFSVLVYPVITMEDGVTHSGSKTNLIGPNVSEVDVRKFSNELNVNKKTPLTYIVHAVDDKAVPIENAYRYLSALDKFGVAHKLYKYEKGGHGFGMFNKLEEGDWFADMITWLERYK